MATTVTKPQPVDRLETQIVDWRKRLKELMSDLERAATRQKQSTEKRDALVLDAVAGNNAQARKQLEKVREELREAERETEELDLAVRKVEEKLKDLERAHQKAARHVKEKEREELSARQLEIARQLDQHLTEVAFWRSEDSANPDTEILNGLRPGMATIPGALLLCISSPYARRGALWEAYRQPPPDLRELQDSHRRPYNQLM